MSTSIKSVTRNFLIVVVLNNSRKTKCTKKCAARAKSFFVANYSINFLRFSLLSPLSIVRIYFLFREIISIFKTRASLLALAESV